MFHKTLSSNSKMLKSIFGALSGEYKMHTIGESTLDSLPGTETVQFYSQNIPINITLKSSSEFKTLKVAYKVSSNDKSKTLPNIKSIINEENVREIHFMEGKNQHKSGLMISVGNINYLPLLVDAIVFIPDNLISKFKLKIVTQSGTLNTNSLSIESLDSEYSSSISYNDINVHTLRIKSITGDINLRGCTFVNALLNSEKGCVKFNRCKYFNIYSMAHKDIIISSTRGSLLKLYSKEGSIDLSTSRCDDATINHNCPKRIKIVDFTFINLTISSSFADINLVGCKLDLLKILTKNGPLNITDCAIDVASIKSLDGPVKVLVRHYFINCRIPNVV
ncbi:hypothetical protein BC833DRAFT_389087 [Globomyces pollinis-pini]|nr:hypothetical protein BC833DRAFT_389087 [Globomyces pollinis-pini]